MIKRVVQRLRVLFFPPSGVTRWRRILPYAVLIGIFLVVFIIGGAAWEYTNSATFCGTACHTMPPEYTSYLTSPHARVACVECHLGRGYIAENVTRKAGDVKHIISLAFKNYEFPIKADALRPARETCERCHSPEKFSDDSLREIIQFSNDKENSRSSIYLIMKTGGGSKRLGLGRGIHWHIENPVYFLSFGHSDEEIPYVRVNGEDGTIIEYIDIEADISPSDINSEDLKEMDCITCHNRITHLVYHPEDMVDQLLNRGVVSPSIPEIRKKALEMIYRPYETNELALNGIAGIENYYKAVYPDFYSENTVLILEAITALQDAYEKSVYREQESDWDSHKNNIGHQFSPGCFRCHDGKHLNAQEESIRLECNLCHSIPVVVGSSDFVAVIEVSRGPEPQSHLNPNWIGMHRDVFDYTCSNCHSTDDPGGTSDTSFCSNSACHGYVYQFAGFNAPELREILVSQLPPPLPNPTPIVLDEGPVTFDSIIGPIFQTRCGDCHAENGLQDLNLTKYDSAIAGGASGIVILPGYPEESLLIQKVTADKPHFSKFPDDELGLIVDWISDGALEK